MIQKPIYIRNAEFIDLIRILEVNLPINILTKNLVKNLITRQPVRKGKDILDFFMEIDNNDQTRATIEILQDRKVLTKNKKIVIVPELKKSVLDEF